MQACKADILTLGALGCHAISVATAVTAQDLCGVVKVWPLPADQVEKQCSVALGDVVPSVVKIGVVGTAANARSIAQLLTRFPQVPVEWDPVLASGRGDSLAKDSALMTFRRWLLPRCFLVTPNRGELFKLAGGNDVDQCANLLLAEGVANVLVTDVAGQGQKIEQKLYAKRRQNPVLVIARGCRETTMARVVDSPRPWRRDWRWVTHLAVLLLFPSISFMIR